MTSSTSHSQQTVLANNADSESVVRGTNADGHLNVDGSAGFTKTRAQVRAELLEAERAGTVPIHRNDYPPSAETIAHNRARFQQVERGWRTGDQTTASAQ
ncbi:hypothetical protein EOS_41085 [Caballeronia mineralivorans PML1(12)]|uniref:DUF4148 domain-containing protein n=1 Tax=Caballeronia mineralivorans PML1(12) TaxID=908627 RepID=A0A0J1FLE4_9BURK|nr:hypothetical protein EOS_41085 [Caballeronia mineralivorans PML1(12)]